VTSDATTAEIPAAPREFAFEFRGSGREYFSIWIVNLALTVITLGIYGAWAKVRTQRYFYGNTFVADQAFDYHASPVRILIGRTIAVTLLVSYNVTVNIYPSSILYWIPFFLVVVPWLINSSLRFHARNTSYRNVRFNFTGRYLGALRAYILWPFLGACTFGLMVPLARRVGDYYFINHHTFGGRPFNTQFPAKKIYLAYLYGILWFLVALALAGGAMFGIGYATEKMGTLWKSPMAAQVLGFIFIIFAEIAFITAATVTRIMVVNLSVSNTRIDGRHALRSRMSSLRVGWIVVTNSILTLATIGLFYPWARVRLWRYQVRRSSLLAASDLDEFTSEAFGSQSAVGEEIVGFFNFDFGL
jgi:uncharacterized membrane protein YjgN (DUF898 family)